MLQRIPLPYELSGDFVSVKLDHMLMPFKLLRALTMAHFHYKGAHALSICLEAHESLSACTLSTPKRQKQAIVSVEITHIQNALQEVLWWQDE